jgi:hypothetical protein
MRSPICWLAVSFSRPALATLRILPRSGRIAWVLRLRACLAEPPAESPSTMNSSAPSARCSGAVGELAGQAQLAHRGLAVDFLFLAAAQTLVGALEHPFEQLGLAGLSAASGRTDRERVLDDALGFDGRELVLGLADEFRLADEHRQHADGRDHHVIGGDDRRALVLPTSSA